VTTPYSHGGLEAVGSQAECASAVLRLGRSGGGKRRGGENLAENASFVASVTMVCISAAAHKEERRMAILPKDKLCRAGADKAPALFSWLLLHIQPSSSSSATCVSVRLNGVVQPTLSRL